MPPQPLYPGLGPLPETLNTPQYPGTAGPGLRDEGLELLKSMFTPPTLQEQEYRRLREHYMGPMRRSVEEAMGAPVPKRTVPERMANQRAQTEKDYYAAPVGEPDRPYTTAAQSEYAKNAPKLPESASGQAVPTPTDETMARRMMDAMGGIGLGMIGRGFSMGGTPAEIAMTYFLRSRRNPENLNPTLQSEANKQSGPSAESLVNEVGPGSKTGQHTLQQIIPNVTPPIDTYRPDLRYTPGYNMPELPFYFQ